MFFPTVPPLAPIFRNACYVLVEKDAQVGERPVLLRQLWKLQLRKMQKFD
jgi:hypothetical protein